MGLPGRWSRGQHQWLLMIISCLELRESILEPQPIQRWGHSGRGWGGGYAIAFRHDELDAPGSQRTAGRDFAGGSMVDRKCILQRSGNEAQQGGWTRTITVNRAMCARDLPITFYFLPTAFVARSRDTASLLQVDGRFRCRGIFGGCCQWRPIGVLLSVVSSRIAFTDKVAIFSRGGRVVHGGVLQRQAQCDSYGSYRKLSCRGGSNTGSVEMSTAQRIRSLKPLANHR